MAVRRAKWERPWDGGNVVLAMPPPSVTERAQAERRGSEVAQQAAERLAAVEQVRSDTADALGRLQAHDAEAARTAAHLRRSNDSVRAVVTAPPLCSDKEAADILRRCGCTCANGAPDASPRFQALSDALLAIEAAERLGLTDAFNEAAEAGAALEATRRKARLRLPLVDWAAFETAVHERRMLQHPPSATLLQAVHPEESLAAADSWSPRAHSAEPCGAKQQALEALQRAERLGSMAQRAVGPASVSPHRATQREAPPCSACRLAGMRQMPSLPPVPAMGGCVAVVLLSCTSSVPSEWPSALQPVHRAASPIHPPPVRRAALPQRPQCVAARCSVLTPEWLQRPKQPFRMTNFGAPQRLACMRQSSHGTAPQQRGWRRSQRRPAP
eukprot:Hpha_TRINITY_DN30845_c0_g1::TRINITY_DN30845_c0_g1_i1::g.155544::m.155544